MAFENRYSSLDRLLHKLAFSTLKAQIGLADVEDLLFRDRLTSINLDRPIFITALPRAGTTLLLELCVASGDFASHTYRHMPFILIPLLWNRFSEGFRRSDAPRERAHGDGMLVSVDSPEAFEETVWMAFWPDRYQHDCIVPWRKEEDSVFQTFLANHFKKIIALSAKPGDSFANFPQPSPRYISKNNLNIARIAWLSRNFRDALFLIPFRDPIQHCASLLRQHLNFLEIHQRDPFARRYMEGIGHFDFGETLRPVDFGGWYRRSTYHNPKEIGFWLEYWCATYRSLLGEATKRVALLNYDAFCAEPERGLEGITQFIEVENTHAFLSQDQRIRAPSFHELEDDSLDETLVEEAKTLYAHLAAVSIV